MDMADAIQQERKPLPSTNKEDEMSSTMKILKSPKHVQNKYVTKGFGTKNNNDTSKVSDIDKLAADKKKSKKKSNSDSFPLGKPHFESNDLFSRLEKAMTNLNESEYHDALDTVLTTTDNANVNVKKQLLLPLKASNKVPLIKGLKKIEESKYEFSDRFVDLSKKRGNLTARDTNQKTTEMRAGPVRTKSAPRNFRKDDSSASGHKSDRNIGNKSERD